MLQPAGENLLIQARLNGWLGNQLYGIVSVAAFTGMRRNETLALRWSDLNAAKKTLRIERALEETKQHGIRFKGPKRESHKRTITIDDDLLALLLAERAKHLRLVAGVPEGVALELGLVRLPEGSLMFPNLIGGRASLGRPVQYSPARRASSALRGFAFTTCGGPTRRCCSTMVFRYMWSRPGAVMILPRCCGLTPRGHARPTHRQPASSAVFQRVY